MNRQQLVLNIEQLALFLSVPKSTVYKLVRSREIPGHKVGRHWRFSREAILRWLEESNSVQLKGENRAD
ncbi:MAG: helix-turn-helix domain-containing protein [Ignavibacteriota bacterium]